MENHKPMILIVEDDEPSYLYLESVLRNSPVVVVRASNGLEALNMCTSKPEINLVLMDLKMPVMDGLDATRRIKAIREELPIMAVTAYAFSGDEKIVREAGCDEYLTKPVRKEILFRKLKAFGITV
jgi:two-component system cell cycle response regulator DivK